MSEDEDKIEEILRSIDALRSENAQKPKDFWDKAAVVGQLISGIVIAVVGYFITVSLDHGQASNAKAIATAQIQSATDLQHLQNQLSQSTATAQLEFQRLAQEANLDATNRQIVGDYFSKLISAKPEDRAEFIDALDVELGPSYSVPLAVRFTRPIPIRDEICNGRLRQSAESNQAQKENLVVARKASDLLQRLKVKGRQQLREISESRFQPD